jgi:hypothetical protein
MMGMEGGWEGRVEQREKCEEKGGMMIPPASFTRTALSVFTECGEDIV